MTVDKDLKSNNNSKVKPFRYFSAFSGIGGFEIGIQQAVANKIKSKEQSKKCAASELGDSTDTTDSDGNRWWSSATCVGYSEIDKYAIKVYERNFNGNSEWNKLPKSGDRTENGPTSQLPTNTSREQESNNVNGGHKNYGDITKINADELPDFDCLVGGFPCQAFSIAGKRKGFDDTRGTLFFDLARILRAKQPRLFVFENVKGLLSHDNGNTFKTIIATIDELGYDCQWQVLNSKNHGVPQNRERVIIVGHLRGTPRPEVFPIGENTNQISIEHIRSIKGKENTRIGERDMVYGTDGILGALKATDYKQPKQILQLNNPTHSNNRVYGSSGISPTLNTMQGGNRQPFVAPVLTPDRLNKRQNGRRFKENGEPSFTLNTQDRHGIYDGMKIRRLTPVECERLQGFPDGWTALGVGKPISDSQRYKMCGNAVTTNVIRDVFERIFNYEL